MTHDDAAFTGSIPGLYERHLGPLFFAPYATDIAMRAQESGARRVLEIAAGTGIVTRALALALREAEIEATDLNDAMVAYAATRSDSSTIRWSTADAMALPFENERFELAVCQFGVMFFPDRLRAFREVRRVLTAPATFLFNVWDSLAHNDVARIVCETVEAAFPDDPPQFVRRTPHGHGDSDAIVRDLREAGFADIEWELVAQRSRATSARDVAVGLCEGTPLRYEILARDPQRLDDVVAAATRALQRTFDGDTIDAAMRAYVFTARRSAASSA